MAEQVSFWTRLGSVFRGGAVDHAEDDPTRPVVDLESQASPRPRTDGSEPASKPALARHQSALDRLEDGYATVVNLVESIQKHLELQGQRAERMTHSLDRLAASLEHLPGESRRHSDLLSGINEHVEAEAASAKHAEELLSQIPPIADAQRETMVSMGRQLDLLRESSDRGTTTLGEFQEAVAKLSEASGASVTALRDMDAASAVRGERLAELLREQTRRLTLFAWLAVAAAAVALALGIVSLLR